MEFIKATQLTYHNGNDLIIDLADFRIIEGEKYGLIGPNGAGKTTLIRLITGDIEPDRGTLYRKPDIKFGLVDQLPNYQEGTTVAEYMLEAFKSLKAKMSRLEESMATAEEQQLPLLLTEYQETLELFEKEGGYAAQENMEKTLQGLGMDNPVDQPMETLSGGEMSLICFARALLKRPDLLILDEPGNHLDYLGLAWLESFLQNYPGAVLIVSHNRYLLDKTCENIMEILNSRLTVHRGTYSSYRSEQLKRAILLQNEILGRQKEIRELDRRISELQSIAQSQYNPPPRVIAQLSAAKKKRAQLREKQTEMPKIDSGEIKIRLKESDSKSRIALRISDFSFAYGENSLFDHAAMEIQRGEKVALTGPNGCGKSTLLTQLMAEGSWDHPRLKFGPSIKVGYLSQKGQFNEPDGTVEEETRSWGSLTRDDAFALISPFLFSYQDMEKRVSVLSGGERNRLQLARLIYQGADLLILDEPTNHMDIQSRENIEKALTEFDGTILVVSHDRYFLDQLVSRIVDVQQKKLVSYGGNFSDFFHE